MIKYIIKRILMIIPVLLGVTLLIFLILQMTPGDPVYAILGTEITPEQYAAKAAELGLDKPLLIRYVNYVIGIVTKLDFGVSYATGLSVADSLLARIPYTLTIGLLGIALAVSIGIPMGIAAATKQDSVIDRAVRSGSLIFSSMPDFCAALILMLLFALKLGWLPATFNGTWKAYVLPIIALGLPPVSNITRMTRASMLETVRQDYIRTARAKGISEKRVIRHHAIRNSLIPVLTSVGMQVGAIMAGSVVIETIFALPGVGSLMKAAISARNYPIVMGGVLMISIWICLINLLVDLAYGAVDPRILSNYKSNSRAKGRSKE